jgi:hypothetical protein
MATLTSSLAIGYLNHALGAGMSATTNAAGYLPVNLATPKLSTSWRSSTGSLTSQQLIADLTSSRDIDVIALVGFNGEDDATATIKTSEASNLSSPEYNPGSAPAWDATTYPYLLTDRATQEAIYPYGRNLIHFPGITKNSRYVGISLSDSGNPNNRLSGRVFWAGPVFQPADSFLIEHEKFVKRRVPIGTPGMQRSLRALDLELYMLTEGEAIKVESLMAARLGTGRLLVVPRPTMPETFLDEALYCRLDLEKNPPARSVIPTSGGLRWKMHLTFLECED